MAEKGLTQNDDHHVFQKWTIEYLLTKINRLLKLPENIFSRVKKGLIKELAEEFRQKKKQAIFKEELEKILLEKYEIDITIVNDLYLAEHIVMNSIFSHKKPQEIIKEVQIFESLILKNTKFRENLILFLSCVYINNSYASPSLFANSYDIRIQSLNRLLRNSNGNSIKIKEIMEILVIDTEKIIKYVKEKYLPPNFGEKEQEKFWESIPNIYNPCLQ